jgi:hypothetical protein
MINPFGSNISLMGLFWSFVPTQKSLTYPGAVFSTALAYAQKSRTVSFMGTSLILSIHLGRNIPQIVNPVIGRVAVDMVNLAIRPLTVDKQPRETMCPINLAEKPYLHPATWTAPRRSGALPNLNSSVRLPLPMKIPS